MLFLSAIRRWWRDRNRNIFSYHDGSHWRYADPVSVGMDLESKLPDYIGLLETLKMKTAEIPVGSMREEVVRQQREALVKLTKVGREVFKMEPLDDKTGWGSTNSQVVSVIARYFLFMEGLAQRAQVFTDSPGQASESPPASPTTSSVESGTVAS